MGVVASLDATCWFSACYRRSQAESTYFFVPPVSCVVPSLHSQLVTSEFLITPTATSGVTGLQITYNLPTYQQQPSQQIKSPSLDYWSLSTLSHAPVQSHVPSSTKGSTSSLTTATVSFNLTSYANAAQSNFDVTPLNTPTKLYFIVMSILVAIFLVPTILAVATILILRQRKIYSRYAVGIINQK